MRWHIGMGKRKNASDAFIFYFKASHAFRKITCHLYLHCDKSVINHHFFCQEICSYSSFVLITELLIHILVHQRCLPNPVETKQCLNQHLAGKKTGEPTHLFVTVQNCESYQMNTLRTLIMQDITKCTFPLWNNLLSWEFISLPQTFPSGKLIRDHEEMKGF